MEAIMVHSDGLYGKLQVEINETSRKHIVPQVVSGVEMEEIGSAEQEDLD